MARWRPELLSCPGTTDRSQIVNDETGFLSQEHAFVIISGTDISLMGVFFISHAHKSDI